MIERLEAGVQPSPLWLGRRVRVVDGTTVSMPDTPENQEKYLQPSSQKAGCGFRQMRIVGLFSLASVALLDFAKSSIHVHESILFGQLISTLRRADIVLADRGFCSFHVYWKISQASIDALMRLNGVRKVDFRKGKKLGSNDRLIVWEKPTQRPKGCTQEEFDALPATMILRHVRLTTSARGHRTQTITLVTTLLDSVAYPLQQLAELYLQRWNVELHFRNIKITLGTDALRCQPPRNGGKGSDDARGILEPRPCIDARSGHQASSGSHTAEFQRHCRYPSILEREPRSHARDAAQTKIAAR